MKAVGLCLCGLVAALITVTTSAGQAGFATPGSQDFQPAVEPMNDPACPDQGGILDSVAVPVSDDLELVMIIGGVAPEGGVRYRVGSDDPEVAAVGDPRQAFLPEVFIPEGASVSNSFTVYGLSVGASLLRATSLTPGFLGFTVPLGAWDVGEQAERKFLDPNVSGAHCRDGDDSPILSQDESLLADCGLPARGIVADGVSRLLMRTQAGLPGTACYRIISDPEHDGQIETPVRSTQAVDAIHQASSYLRAPERFESPLSVPVRLVEVEFTYTPSIGNGNTTRMRGWANLIRPPLRVGPRTMERRQRLPVVLESG